AAERRPPQVQPHTSRPTPHDPRFTTYDPRPTIHDPRPTLSGSVRADDPRGDGVADGRFDAVLPVLQAPAVGDDQAVLGGALPDAIGHFGEMDGPDAVVEERGPERGRDAGLNRPHDSRPESRREGVDDEEEDE